LAAAICESEALAVVALLLLLAGAIEDFAMEFEGAAVELAGADEVAGGAEAGSEVAAAGAEPESVADFLLLRVRLAGAAAESGVAVAAAGSVIAASAFLLFLLFFDPLAAVELSELAVAASAEASFFFLWDFFDPESLAVAAVSVPAAAASVEAAFLLFFDFDFLAGVSEVSVEADLSADPLVSVFAFVFFFLLVVVVEVWSSAELAAWGLAKALIPDMTNNMQSPIIHVLSLVCSLVMISSSRFRTGLRQLQKRASGRVGRFPACLRGDHNDTSTDGGQPWKNVGGGNKLWTESSQVDFTSCGKNSSLAVET
jgi:hypothetical protein